MTPLEPSCRYRIVLLALALVMSGPALAGERQGFDWDRYHARQDACLEKDRIAAAYARGYCDDLALRQATRDYSPWGPLGDRR